MSERPYKIAVSDEELDVLQRKLNLVRLPDELDDVGWDYGVPLKEVKRLVARWKDGYEWRKHEKELNELPHLTRDVEVEGFGSLNIHYLHARSQVEGAIPLLFVHGWPGSFHEAARIIPLLTADSEDHPSFHVVAIGLPGFGFSEAPSKKGFAIAQYAETALNLMIALGYEKFVTQGGDWGYRVTRKMAAMYGGKHVQAWHTNHPVPDPPSFIRNPILAFNHFLHTWTPYSPYTDAERRSLDRNKWFEQTQSGYFVEQSTQPQTLGYSLADSPVGLLAWMYEKLVHWTDKYEWDDDEVLTWVSIYWFSRAGPAASLRIYYEFMHASDSHDSTRVGSIPLGVSHFPAEIVSPPRSWIRTVGNVVFQSEHTAGGHFAAFERPRELVDDLRKMYGRGGPAYGAVAGMHGYKV
ncbi:alpha/beta-hydrolase [Heliocybe sulcata]|uniref:Alpha/beta-hydrolase n=1 Tax=Heliocybe sulcata TaxID=5364 RepID=A0A5C3N4W2_9AGAM|nr:alpha/beta-hydrolase [Heliocybe sulcata]